jgi:hypothetical protein
VTRPNPGYALTLQAQAVARTGEESGRAAGAGVLGEVYFGLDSFGVYLGGREGLVLVVLEGVRPFLAALGRVGRDSVLFSPGGEG